MQSGPALSLAAVFALVFRVSEASAEAPPVPQAMRLTFTAPPGLDCPGALVFRDKVNTRMTFDPFDPTAKAELTVTVRRQGLLYQGRLDLRDGAGTLLWPRELPPAADCRLLVERLAFALSVKLDPLGAPAAPPPAATARRSYRLQVGAGAALGWSVAPLPAFGATLDLGVRWPWGSISLEGRAYPDASGTTDGMSFALSRFTGAAVPCGHWRWLFGCGLVELGARRVTPGTDRPTSTVSLPVPSAAGGCTRSLAVAAISLRTMLVTCLREPVRRIPRKDHQRCRDREGAGKATSLLPSRAAVSLPMHLTDK